MSQGHVRTTRVRAALIVVAAIGVLAVAFVLLAHAPFVRSAALRYAIAVAQRDYGIRLQADRLDYNLATLRVGLAGIRLSAEGAANESFFEAAYASVALRRSLLLGRVAFKDISVTNGRVFVHRRADGSTNLPRSDNGPGNDPPALRVDRIDVPRLAIIVQDDEADVGLQVPAIGLVLTPDEGSIALAMPADLRIGSRTTRIAQFAGQAAFDGRALHLTGTEVQTDEASMTADGTVLLLARESRLDMTVRGTADLARLAKWGIDAGELPQGQIAFRVVAVGPLGDPDAALDVTAAHVSWREFLATNVSAHARVNAERAEIDALEFEFSRGKVDAGGSVGFDAGANARLHAAWTGIDAATAARVAAPQSTLLPSAVVSGRLDVAGLLSDMATWSGAVRLRLAPGRNARGRIAVGGELSLALFGGAWRFEGRPRIAAVLPARIAVGGSLGGPTDSPLERPLTGTLRAEPTDLPALLSVLRTIGVAEIPADSVTAGAFEAEFNVSGAAVSPSIAGTVNARDVTGSQVEVASLTATVSGQPLEPKLNVRVDAPVVVLAGQVLNELHASADLTGASVILNDLSASQPGAPGTVAAQGVYDVDTRSYTITLAGTEWQLMADPEQPIAGRLNVRFEGSGTTAVPRGSGTLTWGDASWRDLSLGTVDASVELDGQVARIDARAPAFDAAGTGRIALEAPYIAAVTARAGQLDLARVLHGIDTATPVSGTAGLVLQFDGPLQAWRKGSATFDVATLDATAGNLPLRLAQPAHVRYASERVFVETLEVDAGETRLSATGDLDAFEPSRASAGVLVTLTGEVGEVARAAAATGLTEVPIDGGTGPVALLARINGSLESPLVAADLEIGPGSVELRDAPPVSALVVRAHVESGWLELREGAASYQDAAVTVAGRAPLSWVFPAAAGGTPGNASLHARATNVTPSVLAPFVDAGTAEQLDGAVDATLDVASARPELSALTGELRLDRLELRIADLPVTQRIPTRVVARDGFARVEAWEWTGQGATLNVRGQVRLEDRETAVVASGLVDLRMLTPFVRDAGIATSGSLESRLSMTGPIDAPRVDGDMMLSGGEVRLADPRVIVSDLAMGGIVSRTRARITSLTGTVNGGSLTGSGGVEYGVEGLDLQLSTSIGGMALEFPQGLRSEVDAELDLALKTFPEPSGRLSGAVTVVRGSYREPLAVATGLLAGMRARRLAAGGRVNGSPPLLEALALDVQLQTDEDVTVNNNYGRFQLGGDLRVVGTAAAPSLTGRADFREGGQLFVGRNVYTITVGAIDFANPVTIDPVLHINATTRAGGQDIEVAIDGPADSFTPSFTSSSNPDLGQADLVSLLLTGRLFDDLAPGDAAFVGAQVLGNFSGEVLGFASRAIGLDTIRLGGPETTNLREDPIAAASELDPTTRLTFGKSIGPEVELTFSQSLRDSDAQTWIVEYLPARGLELRLVSDDEDLRSYGFRHDVAFGGPPRATRTDAGSRSAPVERVTEVRVSGDLALSEERVQSVLRLDVGDLFDFVEWQADRDRLEALYFDEGYLTARVILERVQGRDGVSLEYRIMAGPVTRIVATGIDLSAPLRARLERAWAQSAFDDFLQEEAAQIVREALAAERHVQPSVDVRVVDEGATKTLSITVDRGQQTLRTIVRIEGADDTLAEAIMTGLEERGIADQAASNPTAVERDAADYLRSQGYVRAGVTIGAPLFKNGTAIVPLTIDAGPAFSIAGISFEGGARLAEDRKLEAVALMEGVPYDTLAVGLARDRLIARYRREAFPAARVAVRPNIRVEAAEVDLTFVVDEGPQQVLGDVMVTGNRAVDADVIVRRLDLATGAPLQPEALLQARTRLLDMGLFRRVDIASEPAPSADDSSGTLQDSPIRLRVTVEEWPALRLRYGVEIAEQRPEGSVEGRDLTPGLSADVTRRTVLGRAVTLGGAVEWQRRERLARGFLNTGTLFGWPIGSSVVAERSRVDSTALTLVTDRSSITWEQRARVAKSLSLSYAYTFERNHTFDTKLPLPGDPVGPLDITINIARVTAAVAWDTRDDPADTIRGSLMSVSLENAPESAGSDIRFVRELAQAYHFRPWRGVVLASAARVGAVSPLGGQDLLISERFFVGGARTVRGVAEDTLGPRNFLGEPAGGRMLIVLNQELRMPIYKWLRGVAFVDAGNVFARPRDANLRDLVGSLGFGLRLATRFTPLLRVDFAKPVWGAPAGSSGRWTFGFGQAF